MLLAGVLIASGWLTDKGDGGAARWTIGCCCCGLGSPVNTCVWGAVSERCPPLVAPMVVWAPAQVQWSVILAMPEGS